MNSAAGVVRYVGITERAADVRFAEHPSLELLKGNKYPANYPEIGWKFF